MKRINQCLLITLYGYRYLDAVTVRWISRDPLEASYTLREFNRYTISQNNAVNFSDTLGLITIVRRSGGSNCLGGAMSGEGNCIWYPETGGIIDTNKSNNFIQAMAAHGFNCFDKTLNSVGDDIPLRGPNDCKCDCPEGRTILITLWKNEELSNKNKDPWRDPNFLWRWNGGRSDLHAISTDYHVAWWHQIPEMHPWIQPFDRNTHWDDFNGKKPLLCCCQSYAYRLTKKRQRYRQQGVRKISSNNISR